MFKKFTTQQLLTTQPLVLIAILSEELERLHQMAATISDTLIQMEKDGLVPHEPLKAQAPAPKKTPKTPLTP